MKATAILFKSGTIWLSGFVCSLVLGGFVVWATFAPLAEGVVAYGNVSVENNRKVVQHLEGGIIQDVLVKEGEHVVSDQPLLILTDTAVASGRDQISYELANAQASIDRIKSIANEQSNIEFAELDKTSVPNAIRAEVEERQSNLFRQQVNSFVADLEVLNGRKKSLESQVRALQVQIDSNQNAIDFLADEIDRSQDLYANQLIRVSEVSALERDKMSLISKQAALEADQQLAKSRAQEISSEIAQLRASHAEELSRELVDARRQSLSLQEQLEAAQDVVNRTVITAPQAGEVLNLSFTTPGGVVRPGEAILEIVPTNTNLIAIIKIRPVDREAIFEGLEVDARLSSTNSWHAALYAGSIEGISADLKVAPDGSSSYYEARVSLKELKSENLVVEPMPGMPVEAFVYSGRHRTFAEYITEPLFSSFRRGGRE